MMETPGAARFLAFSFVPPPRPPYLLGPKSRNKGDGSGLQVWSWGLKSGEANAEDARDRWLSDAGLIVANPRVIKCVAVHRQFAGVDAGFECFPQEWGLDNLGAIAKLRGF
jgi:hypothetical protein